MNKFKRKVLKQYPSARIEFSESGLQVVANGNFLAEEYFLPDTNDEDTAWEYAAMACRVTQNFNRTHPMRMDLSSLEEKINRINRRKRKANVRANKKKN